MSSRRFNPLRALLDTSTVVAGFRSPSGASAELLRLALRGSFEIVASMPVFFEYQDVLQREDQRLVHGRTIEQVDLFLRVLSRRIIPVEIYFRWGPQLPDENDEKVMDAAINGAVDAIVTHNLRDFRPAAVRHRIQVLTPSQFLHEVKS